MTQRHTPGPWHAKAGLGTWNVNTTTGERTFNICRINTDRIEQEANARLIAAAPDLLEALKALFSSGSSHIRQEAEEIAAKAIAKAEGK